MKEKENVRPFGMRDKVGYAMGDFGNNFTFLFASQFLLVFCTDVLGISAAIVGFIIMGSKIVDAFTDFGMGRICDTAPMTKEGRFRPWIKRAAIPMGVSHMLIYMFWVQDFPLIGRIIWVTVTFLLWGSIFYTACNIPYGSMASVITNVPTERTSLSTYRTVGATVSGLLIGVITPLLIYETNASGQRFIEPKRFTMVAIVFGIISAGIYLLCYKMTTERVQIPPSVDKKKTSAVQVIKSVVTCRPLLAVIAVAIISLVASFATQAMTIYLYKDYFNNTSVQALASMIGTGVMIFMAPVATKLAEKFGRKEVGAAGLLISSLALILLWVLKVRNPIQFVVINTLNSMGLGLNSMLTWAYIGDVIDDQEVKTGIRTDGTVYSTYSFSRKIAQAAAGGLGAWLLGAIGYVSSTEAVIVQTESVKAGIYNCVTILPAVCYLAAFLCLGFLYPLGKKRVEENARILNERRAAKEQ